MYKKCLRYSYCRFRLYTLTHPRVAVARALLQCQGDQGCVVTKLGGSKLQSLPRLCLCICSERTYMKASSRPKHKCTAKFAASHVRLWSADVDSDEARIHCLPQPQTQPLHHCL